MTGDEEGHELSRRDVMAALSAAGVAIGGGATVAWLGDDGEDAERGATTPTATPEAADEATLSDHELSTVAAVADVVYPSAVENTESFATSYAQRRAEADPDRATAVSESVTYLDDYVEVWYETEQFVTLSPELREEVLDRMGADTVSADPDGGPVQRVRYYLVNDLLFALYSSPTGARLVGLENPQGHPGGQNSYTRGPD